MNKGEVKRLIEEYQLKYITHLENSIQEKRVTVDIDESEVLDPEDYSRQTETGNLVLRLKQQVSVAKETLKLLQEISLESKNKVVMGSLVQTEELILYISIPTKTIDYKGKDLIGISIHAPIYRTMINKSVGDTIILGDKKYSILNIW